ncbi:hypothetical protein Dred_0298 [Desulforamulus reducens MI-1]|uniref:ATP-binding protein n=1 Tax=Desulforamulus reducens (strain ATCC BAA-1160 / DSM 100696 / MI-1) TaxID=349161 RepID=A4J194_DESRM|nr:hypothetical protein Dred_0298 [Desulforamulus reducens MI-1]
MFCLIKKLNVNEVSLYREIAKNLVNPLEVIREAISNSHDAQANEIRIKIYRNSDNALCIQISDDGKGMSEEDFERFFNLGDSLKKDNNIGQKGLGTKTYFRSKKLLVESQVSDKRYRAILQEPWEKLSSNVLPEYDFEQIAIKPGENGTFITIEDYKIDKPENYFNFDTLMDYILWYTAAGSFKTKFSNQLSLRKYVKNINISPIIFLDDEINHKKEEFIGEHRFSDPNENPEVVLDEEKNPKSCNYCKHFGPFHRETTIAGKFASFQLYGTVSGINKRREISHFYVGETHKSRFGLYLCKDFIPIINRKDLINDSNYQHYHLLLNSQNFDLTADRNNISNEDDPIVKWVFEEVDKILSKDVKPIAEAAYFNMRREEDEVYKQKKRADELKNRIEHYNSLENLQIDNLPVVKVPNNEAQVAILFTSLLSKYGDLHFDNIRIGHYSDKSTTDLICLDKDNKPILVELEYKLSNLFYHGHSYNTFDIVVCWMVDLELNSKRQTPDHITLKLVKTEDKWFLKYGPDKTIPIIELKSIVNEINNKNN